MWAHIALAALLSSAIYHANVTWLYESSPFADSRFYFLFVVCGAVQGFLTLPALLLLRPTSRLQLALSNAVVLVACGVVMIPAGNTFVTILISIPAFYSLAIIYHRTVGVRFRRHRAGLCPMCGYDLRSGASTACPECGFVRQLMVRRPSKTLKPGQRDP
jgi:hypothetical protein